MPLQYRPGLTKEHLSSSISYQPLTDPLRNRFKRCFEIPANIKTNGIVFDHLVTVYRELRDNSLLPLVKHLHIDPFTNHGPMKPIEINLPSEVFEAGTLSLTSESMNHFQAVLRFENHPNDVIHFQTAPKRYDTLMSALSHASVQAALPSDVLEKIQVEKPFVLIRQGIPPEDQYIGYQHSSGIVILQRDGKTGIINASETDLSGGSGYWRSYETLCRKIISGSSGVFFMLDGYFPPSSVSRP